MFKIKNALLSTLLIISIIVIFLITINLPSFTYAQKIPPWYKPSRYLIYNVTLWHYNASNVIGIENYIIVINLSIVDDSKIKYCMRFILKSIIGEIPEPYVVKNNSQKCDETFEILIPPFLMDPAVFSILGSNMIKGENQEFYYDRLTGVLIYGYEDFPKGGIRYDYSLLETDIKVEPKSPNPYYLIATYASVTALIAGLVYLINTLLIRGRRVKRRKRR